MTTTARQVYVAWRDPESRSIVPVGLLSEVSESGTLSYRFDYLRRAQSLVLFTPLPGLLSLNETYESPRLFPVFRTRQMSPRRKDYPEFLEVLNLTEDADSWEVLQRSEGVRATDRTEVFQGPEGSEGEQLTTVFFARGIRHIPGAGEAVQDLSQGDALELITEETNEINPRAKLMISSSEHAVGYLPDYLVDMVDELAELGSVVQVTVEHLNGPEAASHRRMLCRLTAPWPLGFTPLDGPAFQKITDMAGI